MTLLDLITFVGAAELVALTVVLTALAWPRRAGPQRWLAPTGAPGSRTPRVRRPAVPAEPGRAAPAPPPATPLPPGAPPGDGPGVLAGRSG